MDPAERLGSVIAEKYRLDELLGRGGMGAVYRATHVKVGKRFAVKILHAEIAEHREAARRFLQEAQASTRIGHPGILDVYDVGESEGGVLYMVTELLEGESLAERIARGPLPVAEAAAIAEEVLEPLEAAHRAGVIHRDVKPHNIFLVAETEALTERSSSPGARRVKLLDFGIAKFAATDTSALTRTGTLIGSPLYMAPEQAKAEPDIDARADVWSVGATLFEMLVGTPAHAAPTPVAVVARILMAKAPPPSTLRPGIEPDLDAIVCRALSIVREERFLSAQEMRAALVKYRTGAADTVASFPPQPQISGSSSSSSSRRDTPLESTPPTAATGSAGRTSGADGQPSFGGKARLVVFALALGAVAAASAAWFTRRASSGESTAEARAAGPELPVQVATLPSPSPGAPSASAEAVDASTASAATVSTLLPTAVTAPSASPTTAVSSAKAHPTLPACAAGEHPSSGHCCSRGLEWQIDRCDRPLATTLPF